MESNRDIIAAIYSAFNRRDIDAVFAHIHPDVDWPNSMEGGRVYGYDEVRAYWTRQWGVVNPHVEPVRVAERANGKTLVDVHQVVHDLQGNVILDQMVQHIYAIHNGLVTRMDIHEFPTVRV